MQAEELAPSSLRNRRVERQNKYFKEQVFMKDEARIIAKTHKGEAILTTVDENENEEAFAREAQFVSSKNGNTQGDFAENNYNSDNEIEEAFDFNRGFSTSDVYNTSPGNVNPVSPKSTSEIPNFNESKKLLPNQRNETTPVSNSVNKSFNSKKREVKYKYLSQEQANFYFLLEEYRKENLLSKFDNKLKNHLKTSTFNQIISLRSETNN